MPKLTKSLVEAIEPESGRTIYLWDSRLGGFGVKVMPSGAKKYLIKYRVGAGGRTAPQRWMTLGKHGAITCEQARDLARHALAAVARGDDPQGDKFRQREAARMRDLWERFASEQIGLKKESTATEYQRQWDSILEPLLGKWLVKEVTRSDIERLHKKMHDTPYGANRVLALVSRLMNLAEAWGMRENGSNPCRHVERFREKARERYLSIAEISRLGAALTDTTAAR